jgi:hypothetical protein
MDPQFAGAPRGVSALSALAFAISALALIGAGPGKAPQVKGTVSAPPQRIEARNLGYTRTRITGASSRVRHGDVAVFLQATNTLPLPLPSAKWPVKAHGLRFEPAVVACAVDEEIVFENADKAPITVTIGSEPFGDVQPGKSKTFKCQRGGTLAVRVAEWPMMRAMIFVGEVGIAVRPEADGRFVASAVEGTYELKVIGAGGVIGSRSVTVGKTDQDLGVIDAEDKGEAGKAGGAAPAAGSPGGSAQATAPGAKKPDPPKPAAAPKPRSKSNPEDEIKLEP